MDETPSVLDTVAPCVLSCSVMSNVPRRPASSYRIPPPPPPPGGANPANGSGDEAPDAPAIGLTGKRAGKATLLFMGFVLLSRVLGVVRNMVLAYLFGQSHTTDIYTAAFRVPDILYLLVSGGALSTVFVPVFAEFWNDDKQEDAWKTFGSVMSIVAAIVFVMVVVMEIVAVPVTHLLNPLFDDATVLETARLSRVLLPSQWCFFIGGLMMGTLNARQRFLIPALGPVIYNSGAILGGLLFHKQLGIASLAIGAVAGAVVGNFLLPLWELHRVGARFYLGFDFHHPGVRKVGKLMLPALLGLSLGPLVFWLAQSFLGSDGSISALRNANDLTQAPIGIFAQASAMVLFPTISLLAAQKQWPTFRREISMGIRRILFLTIPASLLMAVLAEPIISLLYLSHKFGVDDVVKAAGALRLYSLATFAWSAQAILARGFYAMQETKTPVIISTGMLVFFGFLCWLLTQVGLGYLSIAGATSLVSTLTMFLFVWTLQKRVGGLDIMGIMVSVVKITAAAGMASLAAWGINRAFLSVLHVEHPGKAISFVILVVGGGLSLAVYVALCALFRVSELRGVREMIKRKS